MQTRRLLLLPGKLQYNRHNPLPEQRLGFLLATECIVYVHKVSCQFIIALVHQPEKDMQVMDTIEDEGLVLLEILNVL